MRPRVVLAEDHPVMAAALRALLAAEYDVVGVVQDGEALIEAVKRLRPDAIVSDIAMPCLNGLAAAVSILATQPDARIVFVTAMDNRPIIRQAMTDGARGYVLKCDAGRELVGAVHVAIDGGQYLSKNALLAAATDDRAAADDEAT